MDSGFAFGQSQMFATPSIDPAINLEHLKHAMLVASQRPQNLQAQRQLQYWQEVCARQAAAAAQAASAAQAPGPGQGLPLLQPQPMQAAAQVLSQPSLFGASHGPTGGASVH